MKKVLRPEEKEESVFYSDFSGKSFGEFAPDVQVQMTFNYGSKYDGAQIVVHLTDEESNQILEYLSERFTNEKRNELKKLLQEYDSIYEHSLDDRAWDICEFYNKCRELIKKLLKIG